MIYKSCSINEVIARIIRNTRIQDTSYIQDMIEWIPEAMGYMRTKMELKYEYEDVNIEFHKGKLPCGLISIQAVEWNGCRLPTSNTVKHYATGSVPRSNDSLDLFMSAIHRQDQTDYTGPGNYIWKSDLESIMSCDLHSSAYYQVEMDYINTSMCDTRVRIHYLSMPMDSNGLPLIPDNENYKEALYYYVRAKMIGTGYKDIAFNEIDLMQRFEMYAARAMGQIRYPSTDMMENRITTLTRFIPPAYYWDNFFNTGENEPIYNNS